MRATIRIIFLLTTAAGIASAQTASQRKPDADRLGMTCAQILKMTSTEWIAYFGEKAQAATTNKATGVVRATTAYGKCYDARTDSLAVALTKSGKVPSKAARADFIGFEAALKDFSTKALADSQPVADPQKRSYAALYEKQFRYRFYEKYEPKSASPAGALKPPAQSAESKTVQKSSAPALASGSSQGASNDTDEMTRAKNRFGELLGALPDEKLHEVHAAFGEILGLHEVDDATKLAVYRYAIFLLEPSSGQSSYPPPF